MKTGQRVAAASMLISGILALVKLFAGIKGHSTSVTADGLESASDVFASGFVLLGLTLAAKPADEDHPYGHGRIEILTGLLIGLGLSAGGSLICYGSVERLGHPEAAAVASYVIWPLVLSLAAKGALAIYKFGYARRLKSASLTADAWNDMMDTLSAVAALTAVGLTLFQSVPLRRCRQLRRIRGGPDRHRSGRQGSLRHRHAVNGYDARRRTHGRDSRRRHQRSGSSRGRKMLRAKNGAEVSRGSASGSRSANDREAIARPGASGEITYYAEAGLGGGCAGTCGAGAVGAVKSGLTHGRRQSDIDD